MSRLLLPAALCALIAGSTLPASPSALFDPADRGSADEVRAVDLASILEGGPPASGAALEGYEKLPAKCRDGGRRAVSDNCEEDLRCQWLSARFEAGRAWERGDENAKRGAASRLHLLAGALDAGRGCERGSRAQQRWDSDADLALIDASLVDLALLVERGPGRGGAVLSSADQARIEALVTRARSKGLSTLGKVELRGASSLLRQARQRHDWLDAQPNIARLREGLIELWGPLGGVPSGCGERLLEADMLSDRWRGYLVRETVPDALSCLGERYPRDLRRSGRVPRDTGVRRVAAELAEDASRDAGGRRFGSDPEVGRRVRALVAGLTPAAPSEARSRAEARPPRPTKPAARKATAPEGRREAAPVKAPPRSKPATAKPAERRLAATSPPAGRVDRDLIRRAEEVADLIGGREELLVSARSARSAVERDRVMQTLIVTLHRAVCAPLEAVDTADLDAVRRVLSSAPLGQDDSACRQVEGRRGLETLVRAAPRLQRERWAAELRGAARAAALGRMAESRNTLETMPEPLRGATWALLRAWVARSENDPVSASRALARIDAETLTRLRSSPHEGLARVAAHAWAATRAR